MVVRALPWLLLLSTACVQEGIDRPAEPQTTLDQHFFRCRVQPLLTKSCAFMDCHGNDERPLRIYAEQRFRLDVDWLDYETPITDAELDANFRVITGFTDADNASHSLLSEKPLDARFGGRYHRGRDLYGVDDVFLSREEDDYKTLRSFAGGMSESSDCVPSAGGNL